MKQANKSSEYFTSGSLREERSGDNTYVEVKGVNKWRVMYMSGESLSLNATEMTTKWLVALDSIGCVVNLHPMIYSLMSSGNDDGNKFMLFYYST